MPSEVTKKREESGIALEKDERGAWGHRTEGYEMEVRKGLKGPVIIESFDIKFNDAVEKRWEGTLVRTIIFNGPKIGEVKFEFSQEGHKPFHIAAINTEKEYENAKETNEDNVEIVITRKIKSRFMDELRFEVEFMIDDYHRFGGRSFGLISMDVSFITLHEKGAVSGEKRILPLENDYRKKVILHEEEANMKGLLKKIGELV